MRNEGWYEYPHNGMSQASGNYIRKNRKSISLGYNIRV